MSSIISHKENAIVFRNILCPICTLTRYRDPQIFHLIGLRIINKNIGTHKTFPHMSVISFRHPAVMGRCTGGGMGHHYHPAIGHTIHTCMKLTRTNGPGINGNLFIQFKFKFYGITIWEIFIQSYILRKSSFCTAGDKMPSIRCNMIIPRRIIPRSIGNIALPNS